MLTCLVAAHAAAEQPARKAITALRTSQPPVLDGVLDDPVWREAAFVEDLHVVVSDEFAEPAERSRIYVAYDDVAIYFGARFWERNPERIVAKVLRRTDVSFGEDGFTITLDPSDQGRSGYVFDVNPNGMRSEGIYTDVDRQNWDWEGIWDAAARRDAEGWTAETAIPLKTLSFDAARDAWGLNITRWHGYDNEQYGWVSFNRTQDLARTGQLVGLAGLRQGRGLDVVPGIRYSQSHDDRVGASESSLEPSLDVFWKVTPFAMAALTLNPDFAGTTADTRQVNLTRFDLFFPEQRAFFLQDADVFEFGRIDAENGRPFFSRRIGLDDDGNTLRLDAGLKVTGRAGPWNFGIMGVRQDSGAGSGSADLFVGRAFAHVLAESAFGVIATSGSPDGRGNTLGGLDFRYLNTRLGDGRVLEATAWYQKTDTEGLAGDDAAWGISVGMPNRKGWRGEVGFKVLDENYFPALGFANRTDIRDYHLESAYTWRPRSDLIRSVESGVEASLIEGINGRDRTQDVAINLFNIEDQSADYVQLKAILVEERLTEPFEILDGVVISSGDYTYNYACAAVLTGEQRVIAAQVTLCDGEFYDGTLSSAEVGTVWRPSMHLKVGLAGEYNRVRLRQGHFATRLLRLNFDVAFDVAWSWENLVQYDSVSDNIGLNSILRWIPRAGRETLLAIDSHFEDFDGDGRFRSYASDLTFKLSYTFRF